MLKCISFSAWSSSTFQAALEINTHSAISVWSWFNVHQLNFLSSSLSSPYSLSPSTGNLIQVNCPKILSLRSRSHLLMLRKCHTKKMSLCWRKLFQTLASWTYFYVVYKGKLKSNNQPKIFQDSWGLTDCWHYICSNKHNSIIYTHYLESQTFRKGSNSYMM